MERYEDCDDCGERFVGEPAIKDYMRDHDVYARRVCLACKRKRPSRRVKRAAND